MGVFLTVIEKFACDTLIKSLIRHVRQINDANAFFSGFNGSYLPEFHLQNIQCIAIQFLN